MKAAEYFAVVRRFWYILAAGALVGVALAATVSLIQKPTYQASSKAFVSTSYAASVSDLSQGTLLAQQIVSSYADVATTSYVLQPVINRLRLQTTPSLLSKHISVTAPTDTSVIQVTAEATSAQLSAQLANAVAGELESAVSRLSPNSVRSAEVKVVQIDRAIPPLSPSAPNTKQYLVIGAILGFFVSVLGILILVAIDTRVRSNAALEELTGAPVLGSIDRDQELTSLDSVLSDNSQSRAAEQIRGLRTGLQFIEPDRRALSLLVTSSVTGEGKTTVAANLAAAMALAGQSTIVIDADLRRPALARKFGLVTTVGLTDVLIGTADLEDAIQTWGTHGLAVLPAGTIPPNPQELLQSKRMRDVFDQLSERYVNVIIDSPPLLAVADAAVVGQLVGGAILVCSTSSVSKGRVADAVDRLMRVNIKLEGTVATLNRPQSGRRYQTYGYRAVGDE